MNNDARIIGWHRWDQGGEGDDVIILANFSSTTWWHDMNYRIGLPRGGEWKVRFNSDAGCYTGIISKSSKRGKDLSKPTFPVVFDPENSFLKQCQQKSGL